MFFNVLKTPMFSIHCSQCSLLDLSNVASVAAGGYHSLALEDDGTVVAWGNNSYGQTNVPAGLSNVVEIVADGYHSLALRRDGTAIAWGYNGSGALRIPVGVVNIVALGAGLDYSLAIMNDGTPFILRQSPDRTIYSGTTVSFSVAAVGASVLNYQWQFNGRDIDGATNAVLVVTNVALIGAGRYQCLVSNALGTGISSPHRADRFALETSYWRIFLRPAIDQRRVQPASGRLIK